MKLRVENRHDGTTLVQGKVWPAASPSRPRGPFRKTTRSRTARDRRDCTRDGISDMQFDNVRVYKNQ